jgi:hypothetical protein
MTVSPGYSVDPETGEEHADYGLATVDNRSYREAVNQQHYRDQQHDYSPYEDGIYDTGIHEDLDSQALTNAEQIRSWQEYHPTINGTYEDQVKYWLSNQRMSPQERDFLVGQYQEAFEEGSMSGEDIDEMCALIAWKSGELSWEQLCELNPRGVQSLMQLSEGVQQDFMPDEWYESDNDDESDGDYDDNGLTETGSYLLNSFHEEFGQDSYTEMLDWAAYNLTPEEITTYDDAMDSDDFRTMQQAISWLLGKYQQYHNY